MADRSVLVRLIADPSGLVTGFATAAKASKDFGNSQIEMAAKHKQAFDRIGVGTAVAGAALGVFAASALKASADFEAAMSTVKANIDDKGVASMNRLRDAALEAGRTTVFSASQAADAENELAKAGLSAAQITGGALTASLTLASAGQLDLGTSAEYLASTMTQFNLKATDAAHVADVLSAGADKSLGGVTDLAEGLKYAGVTASQFGMNVDQTVGLLADFASAGIMGSMAGTGLREMLVRLAAPTNEAGKEMKATGLNFYDAQGKFLGMANVAQELHTKLSGLSDQQRQQTLATLFGQRAMAEANLLYQQGAAGVDEWTHKVNDQGFATQQAAEKLNNLNGDITKFQNSLNASMIQLGASAQGPLRSLVQNATGAVNAFSGLPPALQGSVLGFAGLGAAVLTAAGGVLVLLPRLAETKQAMADLEIMSGRTGAAISAIGKGFAVAAVADAASMLADVGRAAEVAHPQTQKLADSLLAVSKGSAQSNDFGDLFIPKLRKAMGDVSSASDAFDNFAISAHNALSDDTWSKINRSFDGSAGQFGAQVKQIDDALAQLVKDGHASEAADIMKRLQQAAGNQGVNWNTLKDQFSGYAAALSGGGETAQAAAAKFQAAATENAQALDAQKAAADGARKANDDLITSMENYGDLLRNQRNSEAGFYGAVDNAQARVDKNTDLKKQLADMEAARADISKKYDEADAKSRAKAEAADKKTRDEYAKRIRDAKTPEDKASLQAQEADILGQSKTGLADTLESSATSRKNALDSNASSITNLKKQLEDYKPTLDVTTKAGRDNQKVLDDIADAAKKAAGDIFKNRDANTSLRDAVGKANDKVKEGRDAFIKAAGAFGMSKDEAGKLADQLGLTKDNVDRLSQTIDAIPAQKTTTVAVDSHTADTALAGYNAKLDQMDKRQVTTQVVADFLIMPRETQAGIAAKYAAQDKSTGETASAPGAAALAMLGAPKLYGTGGYTGDGGVNDPAGIVHGREYVINAQTLAKYGRGYFDSLTAGQVGRFAAPSSVTTHNETTNAPVYVDKLYSNDVGDFRSQADRSRLLALGGRRA